GEEQCRAVYARETTSRSAEFRRHLPCPLVRLTGSETGILPGRCSRLPMVAGEGFRCIADTVAAMEGHRVYLRGELGKVRSAGDVAQLLDEGRCSQIAGNGEDV